MYQAHCRSVNKSSMINIVIEPSYAAIQSVRDLCEVWIDLWGGDEWGDSMRALHAAAHTNYGFSDEDCALFTTRLLANLLDQKVWMDDEGRDYGLSNDEDEAAAQAECRKIRDYWLKGGNLGDKQTANTAKATMEMLPSWMFGE